jgi:hypothetical protein
VFLFFAECLSSAEFLGEALKFPLQRFVSCV